MRKKKPDYKDVKIATVIVIAIFIAVFCINHAVWGAAKSPKFSFYDFGGDYDSVYLHIYVQNGTDYDSFFVATFPTLPVIDTAITLNDSTNWILKPIYYAASGDSLPDNPIFLEYNPAVTATVDTSDILALAQNHPSVFYGPTALGSGTDTFTYIAYDSATGEVVNGVVITGRNINGTLIGPQTSVLGGKTEWTPTEGDSLLFTALENGTYFWETDTVIAPANGGVDTIFGYPVPSPASASGSYVSMYMDIGSGLVDSSSGSWIPRDKIKLTLRLVSEGIVYNDSLAIVAEEESKSPDANGRVTFRWPATTVLTPLGAYYELSYTALDGRTRRSGIIRNFVVDTIPDPINIKNTTEIWK